MALDLADVYYHLGDYFRSADYYLRVHQEQYGKTKDKKVLLDNVILALQKKADYSYYEQLRMRGLLIKAVDEYAKVDPKSKNDPKLNFAALKAEFEQGFFRKCSISALSLCVNSKQALRQSMRGT